ncbi:MAG: glycerol-3-phosphate 1-O-acyltransferase PlsY [Coxiella endosymbiont of Haemaphysalis qinghaiensis]
MTFLISIILAYLIGSLSFAIIVAKLMRFPDPRTTGSGNAGATNMLRVSGKQAAFYVLLGDTLKGLIAILIARFLDIHGVSLAFVALVVVIGHVFPLYFKFKGGKGIATMLGAFLGLSFWIGLLLTTTWFIIVYFFHYSSVAALVSAIPAPIYMMVSAHADYFFPVLLIATFVVWNHWENIQRLRKGTEKKIQF